MNDVIAHEEELVSGVAVVSCVKDAIVTHQCLQIEPVLWVTLDPTVNRVSSRIIIAVCMALLYSVATPAGASRDCTIRIDLRILAKGIFPARRKVNKRLPTPVFGDGIRKVC
jgi:hypothetical protein